jgi:hypothetical protein
MLSNVHLHTVHSSSSSSSNKQMLVRVSIFIVLLLLIAYVRLQATDCAHSAASALTL